MVFRNLLWYYGFMGAVFILWLGGLVVSGNLLLFWWLERRRRTALKTKYRELVQLHQATMIFLADIAHRLKTPLAIIQTKADRRATPKNRREISALARDTAATIKNLVQAGKIDQERAVVRRRFSNLALYLKRWESEFRALLPHHRFQTDVPPKVYAHFDPPYIKETLFNLLDNARKFSPPGSTITLTAQEDGNLARLAVTDQGAGINATDLPRIFDRHWQGDEAKRHAGSAGLGLNLVRWVVAAHHGQITVHSRRRQGTTFIIELPITQRPKPLRTGHVRRVLVEE